MSGLSFRRATLSLRAKSLFFAASLLVAAGSVAMANELDTFNPAKTDPNQFRIAVRHSDRLEVPARGAKMVIQMKDRQSGRVLKRKKIFLQRTLLDEEAQTSLSQGSGNRISVFRIPEHQIAALRSLQAKYLSMSKSDQDAIAGTLSVDVSGCKVDPADTGQMLISTFMKTSEMKEFVVLELDYDLRNVPPDSQSGVADPVRPCS